MFSIDVSREQILEMENDSRTDILGEDRFLFHIQVLSRNVAVHLDANHILEPQNPLLSSSTV